MQLFLHFVPVYVHAWICYIDISNRIQLYITKNKKRKMIVNIIEKNIHSKSRFNQMTCLQLSISNNSGSPLVSAMISADNTTFAWYAIAKLGAITGKCIHVEWFTLVHESSHYEHLSSMKIILRSILGAHFITFDRFTNS